jgi:hypothetical protein
MSWYVLSMYERALRNETMPVILEVLEEQQPAVFRQDLFDTLTHYYVEILSWPKPEHFTRKMCTSSSLASGEAAADGCESMEAPAASPAAAAESDPAYPPPPQAAAAAAVDQQPAVAAATT